jgi:hypothetical protein
MENIQSMTAKDLLANLRQYQQYANESDYYIKKAIGGKKLATVDELKKELTKLSTSKHISKSPVKTIKSVVNNNNDNIIVQTQNVPDDVLRQTLLYSDLNTIVNICTANKQTMKLCDNQFWEAKLKHDNLPINNFNNFNDWVKYYKLAIDTRKEAEMMVKITLTFNKYKGYPYINIENKTKKYSPIITISYNKDKKKWEYGEELKPIAYHEVINLLTTELLKSKNGDDINFTGDKDKEIAYDKLVKIKNHTEISKTYLAMYELLMGK